MTNIESMVGIANQLYEKRLVTGTTGNISFIEGNLMHISSSGTCLGMMDANSFSTIDIVKDSISGNPSKEWPIHKAIYNANKDVSFIIHTHSFFSTLFSCSERLDEKISSLFEYTPYLEMLTNRRIKSVPFAAPGSTELFFEFQKKVDSKTRIYILQNHGVVVTGKEAISTLSLLEEFEQTCKLNFYITETNYRKIKDLSSK